MNRGYQWINQLKKDLREQGIRKTIPQLLAMSPQRDPFYAGGPASVRMANWFAGIWDSQYKGQTGVHLRRVHYRVDALQPKFLKLNGMPYINVKRDWEYLTDCSRYARQLELVPADDFDDHRNEAPGDLNWQGEEGGEPYAPSVLIGQRPWFLPSLQLDFSSLIWTLDAPTVQGYDPDDYLDRRYVLELWIEKSTMNDILDPLTKELGVRFVPNIGFQSITNVVKLLQRLKTIGKPTRIFYISDYDKAGKHMPTTVARHIEFWLDTYARNSDIKLETLALTEKQIVKYNLPRSFEKKNSVELDALEALVPGELEKIVRRAVEPYLDPEVGRKRRAARAEANEIVEREWTEWMAEPQRRLTAVQKSVRLAVRKYQAEARRLDLRMQKDLAKFKKPLARLEAQVAELSSRFSPDLPERPTQAMIKENPDWLFDSGRSYLDQLRFYKAQKSK